MGGMEPAYNGSYARRIEISNFLRANRHQSDWQSERRIALRYGEAPVSFPQHTPGLAERIFPELTEYDLLAAEIVAEARPEPLRSFDQISMLAGDLALQAKLVLPMLAGKRVVFMGDNDGASLMLGLMSVFGDKTPLHMLVLDFDQRIIAQARTLAKRHGFADRFEARAYNAFDAVPNDLLGKFDVFYTNPPYGRANVGESAQLFITRGIELCHSKGNAEGCIILPDDPERLWTRRAMRATEAFVLKQGWEIAEKINSLHHYHLPSDPGLTSGMLWTSDVEAGLEMPPARYAGRRVLPEEIEHFYGTKVKLPYPRYVRENGEHDCNWGG